MFSLIDIEVLSYQCLNGRFDKIIVNDLECENIEATPSYASSRLVVSFNLVDTCSISLIPGFIFILLSFNSSQLILGLTQAQSIGIVIGVPLSMLILA